MNEVRMTLVVLDLLGVFLDDIDEPRYGTELMKITGMRSSSVYPALARLEKTGWLISDWEDIDPAAEGRPPRRYFKINPAMAARARYEVDAAAQRLRPRSAKGGRPDLATGSMS